MHQALQIQTKVDQALVDAVPALKPLLGHRVQMIALDLEHADATPPAHPPDALNWPLSDGERAVWDEPIIQGRTSLEAELVGSADMNWLLDTNIISYLLRGDSVVREAFVSVRDAHDTSFILSLVVDYEIRRYLLLRGATRNLAQYEALTATWTAVPLSEADWQQAAVLWADRHRNGTPIEDADLLIAVTALAQDAVLVTHNTRHFAGLDLRLADWTQA